MSGNEGDYYWNKILDEETVREFIKKTADAPSDIDVFYRHIRGRINYKYLVVLMAMWNTYEENKQIDLAIQIAGEYQASRFLALLDILSMQYRKGKFK